MRFYISDCHTDFLTQIKNKNERENFIKNISRQGVKFLCCAVFTTNTSFDINDIKNFNIELKHLSNKYKINLVLTIEDIGFIKNIHDFYDLISLSPFAVTLTWNNKNQFAGGANTNYGITKLGKKAISVLEENNILVDVAHLSKKAFFEFLKITKFPVFCSHSNIHALFSHNRNLTNQQINAIVNSSGFLGLTLYNKFIANFQIDAKDIANQFDYLIKNFGENNFGFGTDLYGIDFKHTPVNICEHSDLQKVANALLDMGYSNGVVEKIMYKNFLNYKTAVSPKQKINQKI